jgi:hypothetical protein
VQIFPSLRIELLKQGFSEVHFLETQCRDCGVWRVAHDAVVEAGNTDPACPQCSSKVQVSPVLAVGFSRQSLPFAEKLRAGFSPAALSWINTQVDDDERDLRRVRKERALGRRGNHVHNRGSKIGQIDPADFEDSKHNPRYAAL